LGCRLLSSGCRRSWRFLVVFVVIKVGVGVEGLGVVFRAQQRRVVDAFFAASRDGDFEALLEVLDPEVALRIDGGVLRADGSLVLHGADAVAAHTVTYAKLYPFVRPALVNGAAGAVVAPPGRVFSVMAFTVTNRKIAQIDVLLDPQRLDQLDLCIPPTAGTHR
jgi:ketosteroid isomerase-like protein